MSVSRNAINQRGLVKVELINIPYNIKEKEFIEKFKKLNIKY
jgi:hypothetical protein